MIKNSLGYELISLDATDDVIKEASTDSILFTILLKYKSNNVQPKNSEIQYEDNLKKIKEIANKDYLKNADILLLQDLIFGLEILSASNLSKKINIFRDNPVCVDKKIYRLVGNKEVGYKLIKESGMLKEKISAIRKTYEKYYIKKEVICLSSSRKSVSNDVYGTLFIFRIDSNKAYRFKENLYKSIGKDAFFDILVYFEEVVVILSPQYPVFNELSNELSEFFSEKKTAE